MGQLKFPFKNAKFSPHNDFRSPYTINTRTLVVQLR